jgi:integrase/recombinase XerD
MTTNEKPFVGAYKEMLEDFINLKRSLGYKYATTRDNLRRFSEYTLNCKIENKSLSKELASEWTTRRKNEAVATWTNRTSGLRQFALYLQNQEYEVFVPPQNKKVRREEYIPYIFTHKEIKNFFQVVDSISPNPRSNGHKSYPLLFRLLYCCGLRISEALHLKIADVDFEQGVLFIRQSKFNKDRLVPMSWPLADMFAKYHALFNGNNLLDESYFRNKNKTPLSDGWIYDVYRKLLWKAGISHGGKGKGPRLHDLRHTFCVHTLVAQVKNNVDLYVALPILSAYLGHSSVGATQRYVRLTAEAYPELIEKISHTCAYVIPEVTHDEAN